MKLKSGMLSVFVVLAIAELTQGQGGRGRRRRRREENRNREGQGLGNPEGYSGGLELNRVSRQVKWRPGRSHDSSVDLWSLTGPRYKRASPNRIGGRLQGLRGRGRGNFRVPGGKTYTWKRELGFGYNVDEAAFAHLEKYGYCTIIRRCLGSVQHNTIATLYDFTGKTPVVVIKPRRRPQPCFLMDTSQTYEEIVMELDIRNGSSVSTNQVINLDDTMTPLTDEERKVLLQQTPSLRRACYRRSIVRTQPLGVASMTFEGETQDMKVLTLDSEVNLTVPARPPRISARSGMFAGNRGQNRGKGQGWRRNRGNRGNRGNLGTQGA